MDMDVAPDETQVPRPPAERLTEREAALYARARQETLRDLVDELARHVAREDEGLDQASWASFWNGYERAQEIITTLRDRIARLSPAPELPDAPCLLLGTRCWFDAGHAGPCDFAPHDVAPAATPVPQPSLWPFFRRIIASALVGVITDLRDSME